MPSPIAHAAAGYAVYRLIPKQKVEKVTGKRGSTPLLLLALALSFLPDIDFLPGLLVGHFDQFHNTISNSLFSGLLVALLFGILLWLKERRHFMFWFTFTLLCYELHVIMDYFTLGRGVMLFWPFTAERFQPAFNLFYGLHRSDGWLSVRHLWTLLTETIFSTVILFALRLTREDRIETRARE